MVQGPQSLISHSIVANVWGRNLLSVNLICIIIIVEWGMKKIKQNFATVVKNFHFMPIQLTPKINFKR